jgi:hypothetical protein
VIPLATAVASCQADGAAPGPDRSYDTFAADCLAADGLAIVEYALELQVCAPTS